MTPPRLYGFQGFRFHTFQGVACLELCPTLSDLFRFLRLHPTSRYTYAKKSQLSNYDAVPDEKFDAAPATAFPDG